MAPRPLSRCAAFAAARLERRRTRTREGANNGGGIDGRGFWARRCCGCRRGGQRGAAPDGRGRGRTAMWAAASRMAGSPVAPCGLPLALGCRRLWWLTSASASVGWPGWDGAVGRLRGRSSPGCSDPIAPAIAIAVCARSCSACRSGLRGWCVGADGGGGRAGCAAAKLGDVGRSQGGSREVTNENAESAGLRKADGFRARALGFRTRPMTFRRPRMP